MYTKQHFLCKNANHWRFQYLEEQIKTVRFQMSPCTPIDVSDVGKLTKVICKVVTSA